MRLSIVCVLLATTALARAATESPRYRFGDDPAWSAADFDDSSWTVARDGKWQAPPFDGSGIMWVRFRVPVPDPSGPLAIRFPLESSVALPAEIWVDGRRAGSIGKFPPQPYARIIPVTTVFELPPRIRHRTTNRNRRVARLVSASPADSSANGRFPV